MKTMTISRTVLALLGGLMTAAGAWAADPDKVSQPVAAAQFDRATLLKEFEATMSGCVLRGSFTARDNPNKTPKEEKYTIAKVEKLPGENDNWVFHVRIQYGTHDVELPLTLQVVWSGDTPVITLTDLAIPGLGKFTSRVLIYRGQYAGTWDGGGNHGGHLFGTVEKLKPADK